MSTSVVLFNGPDAAVGSGLWVTNGTVAGTSELGQLPADTFFGFGSEVLFRANAFGGPYYGLGVSDGTISGTSEIYVGTGQFGLNPSDFSQLGSEVLFEGWAGGWNLWVTNGTTAGTSELSVAGTGSYGLFGVNSIDGVFSADPGFTVLGSKMLFSGIDASNHDNLWVTEGTAAGTSELSVVGVSPSGLGATNLFVFGSEVLFDGTDSSNRQGLWVTDGTAAGTSELSTPALGFASPFAFGSEILFEGVDTGNRPGLWVTNGTAAGTSELSINGTGSNGIFGGGAQPAFTRSGSEVLFAGVDASGKLNPWVTDGTGAGTSELSVAGASSTGLNPKYLTAFGSEVVFAGTDTNGYFNLWITNGTTAGTSELATSSRGLFTDAFSSPFTVYGSEVLFQGLDASGHLNLWVTDGTIAGTSELPIAGAVGPRNAYVLTFPPTTVTSVVAAPVNGVEGVGAAITITVGLSKAVTVTGGTPTLTLNDGGLAFYNAAATAALHDPTKLVFSYTVGASNHEHNVGELVVQDGSLNGATVLDSVGNTPDFFGLATAFPDLQVIVSPPATVTSVVASPASGVEGVGATVAFTVGLSTAVTVTGGTPTLTLNDGGTATYDAAATAALGDPTKLVFDYTVKATDFSVLTAQGLGVAGYSFDGATVQDALGNAPDFSGVLKSFPDIDVYAPTTVTSVVTSPSSGVLGVGQAVTVMVGMSRAVRVSGEPTLTLNDGGLAFYDAAATAALGDPTKLVFNYTVGATAHEHNVGALTVQSASLNGLILDGGGNVPDFSGLAAFPGRPVVIAPPAVVTSVVASPGSGIEYAGQTVTITVALSAAVTVSGGTPTLALNDGGTATYSAAATAALGDPTKLVFEYTVGATDQLVTTLGVVGGGFNGATIADAAGNVPDFTGVLTSFPGLGLATTVIGNGQIVAVGSGQYAANEVVLSGGILAVDSGGIVNGVFVSGGTVTDGGIVVDAVLRGGTVDVGGTAIGTVVSGGTLTVDAGDGFGGGTADGTIIDNGGVMFVDPVNNIFFHQPGTANNTTINSGGIEYLESGASASGTIVNSGGTLVLLDGAGLNGITLNVGAILDRVDLGLTVSAGQMSIDTFVVGTLEAAVFDGQATVSPMVVGQLTVASGGTAVNTTVDSGGHDTVLQGGIANGTIVNSGGVESFAAPYIGGPLGGTAIGTTINNGGSQIVDNGGTARGTVVNSGGSLQVELGVASGTTINSGGTEYVHSGGTASDVTFGGTAATLDLESPTGLSGTISDWQVGDVIDFVSTSVTSAGISGSTLTITTSGGQSVSYQLAGWQQPGTEVDLQADNHGGTDVALEPVVTSVVASPSSGIEHPGQTVAITVGLRRAVSVTGGTPTLTLNDGGLAYYDAAATAALGDPTKLVFSYTVGATGHEHNVGALTVQDASLNGALVLDASGTVPDFSALATVFANLQVVIAPAATVTSVVASPGSGIALLDQAVTITVGLSNAVTVTGGTPTLALSDGGTASYDAAATAALGDPTKLVFGYTVGITNKGVTTLGIVGGSFNGASITDAAGNVPDFSGALTSFLGLGVNPLGGNLQAAATGIDLTTIEFPGLEISPPPTAANNQTTPSGIDLTTIAFGTATTLAYAPNQGNTGGSLTVSDGAHNASIALLGQYMAGDFHAASDFHGGTLVTDPALTGAALATFVASPHT